MNTKLAIYAACMMLLASPALAQPPEDRYQSFLDAAGIVGKIEAMNAACPLDERKQNKERLREQVMEGFALEKGTDKQLRELQSAADDSFRTKSAELESREELKCESSDVIWEKQILYDELLVALKEINKSRKAEN